MACLFAVAVAAVYFSLQFSREVGRVAAIWPLNAIVVSLLARLPARARPRVLLVVFLANFLTTVLMGDSIVRAALLACGNALEIALCSLLLFKPEGKFDISRIATLKRFAIVACVLAPAASAIWTSVVSFGTRPFLETLVSWFAADALGMLVFAPALLTFGSKSEDEATPLRLRHVAISGAVLSVCLVVVFAQRTFPLLFIIPPALTFATFYVGVRGAATGILLTALVAIAATIAGYGPVQLVGGGETAKLYTLQCFLAFISITTLPVAAALARAKAVLRQSESTNAALQAARDDSERAKAEAFESARRYRDLADHSTDIVVRFGPGGVISYASPAVRMLGVTPEEAIGRSTVEFVSPEDREFAQAVTDELFSGREADASLRREFRIRRPDGSIIWLEGSPSILRNQAGKPVEVVSVYRDITSRQELAASLVQAREAAEAAARAKSDFLANTSHELRTPLNSIIGFTRLLRESEALPAKEQRFAEIVSASAESLLTIVNDILDISSAEAGAIRLEARPFSLRTLFAQCVESLRPQANAKAIELRATIGLNVGEIYVGDEGRLRQILLNLIGNAVKFTTKGCVECRLAVIERGENSDNICIEIADTGIGIPPERVAKLFERFEQGDPSVSRRFGGTGLGLAISKHLAERMGGGISVKSALGEGTVFTLTLRLRVGNGSEAAIAARADAPPAATATGKRILLVDDVELNRELVLLLLLGAGHKIEVASDGEQAVRCALEQEFDIILMDVQMPNVDGLSATRLIRANPMRASVPIIAMTAQALPDQIAACYAAGMNDYLSKPLALDALRIMIAKWTDSHPPQAAPPKVNDRAKELRLRFIDESRSALAEIERTLAMEPNGYIELHHLVHRLAGSATMFGFAEVGAAARELDQKLGSKVTTGRKDFAQLLDTLKRVVAA